MKENSSIFSIKRNEFGRVKISFKKLTLKIQNVSMLIIIIGALLCTSMEGDGSLLGGVVGLPLAAAGLAVFLQDKEAEEKEKKKR